MDPSANGSYEFGPFRLDPQERLLVRDGHTLTLTPKAFDTLLLLVENSGHLLTKEEMMSRLWQETFVEEANLTNNISILRKALGETQDEHSYIRTVARVGYRFVASVRQTSGNAAEVIVDEPATSTLVGREDLIAGGYEKASAQDGVSGIRRLALQTLAACVVLAGFAVGSYFWINQRKKASATGVRIRSIAVLPFKPLVAGSRNEALELGMADTLITKLSNLTEITVRPITAVRKYTSLEQDPVAVGREQQVDAVLDSSLQWSDEKMRVTVRLIRVRDGSQLWTHDCNEQCADIFTMEDSIAEEIAGALALKLTNEERELLRRHYTENREAFQLYLMGRFFWNKWTLEGEKKSIEYYQQAIDKDPNYALAYAGIADSYTQLGSWFGVPLTEAVPKAKEAALKALEIDETLAEAHTALGRAKMLYDWDWSGAERELKRAVELDPNYAVAHSTYGVYLNIMGRWDESVAEARRGQELDQLSLFANSVLEKRFYYAHRYDQAIEQCRKTLEIDPNYAPAHADLAMAYLFKGMHDEAVAEFERLDLVSGSNPELGAARRRAYQAAGMRGFLQTQLDQMKEEEGRSAKDLAAQYALLGKKDQALEWLKKAYEKHHAGFISSKGSQRLTTCALTRGSQICCGASDFQSDWEILTSSSWVNRKAFDPVPIPS